MKNIRTFPKTCPKAQALTDEPVDTLSERHGACLHEVHEKVSLEKVQLLNQLLARLGVLLTFRTIGEDHTFWTCL